MNGRNSGPRSNAWSESKLTNQTSFDPQHEEKSRAFERFYEDWSSSNETIIRRMPLHQRFIMPVCEAEIAETLARLPDRFKVGLKAVILLGGSSKQGKVRSSFLYGRYAFNGVIYLHAFPKWRLKRSYKRAPRPHILDEYKRAGAYITSRNGTCIIEFTESSLKQFYLRDVLMHEIGHHVDNPNVGSKSLKKEEGFAEWFATEYGFRLSR